MIKSGPYVINEVMLANCHISCLHEIHAYYTQSIKAFLVKRQAFPESVIYITQGTTSQTSF